MAYIALTITCVIAAICGWGVPDSADFILRSRAAEPRDEADLDLDGFRPEYSYKAGGGARLAFAAVEVACCVAVGLPAAMAGSPTLAVLNGVWGALLALFSSLIVICDLRARIIPRTTCFVLGAYGIVWQVITFGTISALVTAGVALIVWLCCVGINRINKAKHGYAVGGGDVRAFAALIMATGIGNAHVHPAIGVVAMFAVMAVYVALKALRGKPVRGVYLPMAPFFAVWAGMSTLIVAHWQWCNLLM